MTGIEVNGEVYFPRLRVIAQVLKARGAITRNLGK